MHVPVAAAAGLPGSSGGLSSMQSCRPSAFADSASPICRGCGQQLLRRQRQTQRRGRRIITALARRAPQPCNCASAEADAAVAESGGLPDISAIRSQTEVEDLASHQCIGALVAFGHNAQAALQSPRLVPFILLLGCLRTPALNRAILHSAATKWETSSQARFVLLLAIARLPEHLRSCWEHPNPYYMRHTA